MWSMFASFEQRQKIAKHQSDQIATSKRLIVEAKIERAGKQALVEMSERKRVCGWNSWHLSSKPINQK